MKITNTKIIRVGIVCLAVLACVFAIWKLHSVPAAPTTATSGYVVKNDTVYWDEYMQVYDGENNPPAQKLNEFEVAGADAATFKTVPLKKGVNLEADADPNIFAAETSSWGKDKAHIFDQGQEVMSLSSTIPVIDTNTFETLGGVFVRDKQGVYEIGNQYYWLIPGVDPKSFVVVNRQYAKDAHTVYYLQNNGNSYDVFPINGLDPNTFHIIGVCGSAEVYQSFYAADAHEVVAVNQVVSGADPTTFRIVAQVDKNPDGIGIGGSFAVDKNHVYKDCGEIVAGANPAHCTADNLNGCEAK